jgi:cyclic pyranopterin phosphate synthase
MADKRKAKKAKQLRGMVDVSAKNVTKRLARASSTIVLGRKAYRALVEGRSPKGNVLEAAKLAAVMAAKSTAALIPMCHPLSINQVLVDFACDAKAGAVTSLVEVNYEGKTGVEMEALLAAAVASLTIYDMMKWAGKDMVIGETLLLEKRGGKSGDYLRSGPRR